MRDYRYFFGEHAHWIWFIWTKMARKTKTTRPMTEHVKKRRERTSCGRNPLHKFSPMSGLTRGWCEYTFITCVWKPWTILLESTEKHDFVMFRSKPPTDIFWGKQVALYKMTIHYLHVPCSMLKIGEAFWGTENEAEWIGKAMNCRELQTLSTGAACKASYILT